MSYKILNSGYLYLGISVQMKKPENKNLDEKKKFKWLKNYVDEKKVILIQKNMSQ